MTKPILEECIYNICFQYLTAQKVVLLVPEIYYSKWMAEQMMIWGNYARGEKGGLKLTDQEGGALVSVAREGEESKNAQLNFVFQEVSSHM